MYQKNIIMKHFILIILTTVIMESNTIFNFNSSSDLSSWYVVDDVVMGGKSSGEFNLNKDGNGVFKGTVSLENNGGFSSLRYRFNELSTKQYSKIKIKLKGDGKKYQFRIKHKSSDYYSYNSEFVSTGEWQTIELGLSNMSPIYRGRKLRMDNFDANSIEEIAFLIGNKKEERFKLEIDSILMEL